MVNLSLLTQMGFEYVDEYKFDDTHRSFILKKGPICIIVDDDICKTDSTYLFDYSKYCEMQNTYMASYSKVYRFNCIDDSVYQEIAAIQNLVRQSNEPAVENEILDRVRQVVHSTAEMSRYVNNRCHLVHLKTTQDL